MHRYIEADALIEYANNQRDKAIDANDIARFPAADVVPVVHGKWITKLIGERPYCSACYKTHDCFEWTPRYCPNCGAKMGEVTT